MDRESPKLQLLASRQQIRFRKSIAQPFGTLLERIERLQPVLHKEQITAFVETTFDTDLDVEGFTPTDAENQNVAAAIASGNYTEFRKALIAIEESLRDRVGRWVQRYPQIQAKIGTRFTITDIVEETFMLAFDVTTIGSQQCFSANGSKR